MASEAMPIRGRKDFPRKIRFGRVLMYIGCILFFFNAFGNLLAFGLTFFYFFPRDVIPELNDVFEQFGYYWTNFFGISETAFRPLIAIFLILAGIGGISWLRDKGPLMSLAPLAAIISLVIIVGNLIADIRLLIISKGDWQAFILALLDLQLTCGIYFIGWSIAKNQID